jgi:hypothetical protein
MRVHRAFPAYTELSQAFLVYRGERKEGKKKKEIKKETRKKTF